MAEQKPKRGGVFEEQPKRSTDGYVGWNNAKSQEVAFKAYGAALNIVKLDHKSSAALSDTFRGIDGNTSIRSPMTRQDYEVFRPTEQIPRFQQDIIATCMNAYEKVGLVRNIIDLMADFACQGIKLTHRNPKVEKFYQAWWDKVNGAERSERLLNMLYRSGNVVAKRSTAVMNAETIKQFNSTVADINYYPNMLDDDIFESTGPDLDIEEDFVPKKNEIPWVYTILNPISLHVLGEELNIFVGQPYYALKIPHNTADTIRKPKNKAEKQMVDSMPADIRDAVRSGLNAVPLDPTRVITMFYKKDDWRVWAIPMLYSVLDDLILLEKLKLADLTALDGAIQHIRIWKLGNLELGLLPTEAIMARLSDVLLNNVGGGSMDLIWGPDIELQETSTDIQKFLGSEKYGPVLTSICSGLGIPLTLSGASENSSYTNNFISLKTLVERLTYGRNVLIQMWKKEIAIVQKAMGFRYPAEILFDSMNISDDASEKAIWMDMFDRNLVSIETMQEKFGQIPEIENLRIQRNFTAMKAGTIPPKVGPFEDPNQSLKKISLQSGFIRPQDVGIEGKPMPIPGNATNQPNPKGTPGKGRPKNSTDKNGRKKRVVKPLSPSSKAEEFQDISMWAFAAQKEITDIVNPILLDKYGKKNLVSLTKAESKELEQFKFSLLYNFDPFEIVDEESINDVVTEGMLVYSYIDAMKDKLVKDFAERKDRAASPDELRQINSLAYAACKGEFE